ncbi:MAG: CpXC domain-containing protein [Oscillospiraceae bacterium]|nr:CpXC domain-containing protein [Oscillospiraceae bacterium]
MQKSVIKEIICPKCNQTTEGKLYTSVNATNNPHLRNEILEENLFRWRCHSCGHEASLTYPMLYNDMKKRFMIYLIPEIDRFQLADNELEEEFKNLKGIRKRLAPDFNTFREKLFIFESGLDDMAVEMTKLAISESVARKLNLREVTEGYLSMYDRESNSMGFTFLIGLEKEPYIQSVRLEIYSKSLAIVEELAVKDRNLNGFLTIDREWATNILYRYKRQKQREKIHKDEILNS